MIGIHINNSDETTYISRWDGTAWQDLSDGLGTAVYCQTFSPEGKVIVSIGMGVDNWDDSANKIMILEDTGWQEFTPRLDDLVNTLMTDSNNNLYAGGSFTIAGQKAAYGVARWNAQEWSGLAQANGAKGCEGPVVTMAGDGVHGVYAGGDFITAGNIAANHIAHWDGSQWKPLGEGFDGPVNALTLDPRGILYAAGSFLMDGSAVTDRIARWNGVSWESLESGINGAPYSLTTDAAGNLFAGAISIVFRGWMPIV